MSYCRFVEADAYIFDHANFGLYCMGCSLMPLKTGYSTFFKEDITFHEDFIAGYDYDLMLAHVAEHRLAGDYIPENVDERLIFERDCKHGFNSE
jgi:hypothetical protein